MCSYSGQGFQAFPLIIISCSLTGPIGQFEQEFLSTNAVEFMSQPVNQVSSYWLNCICCQANMQPLQSFAALLWKSTLACTRLSAFAEGKALTVV